MSDDDVQAVLLACAKSEDNVLWVTCSNGRRIAIPKDVTLYVLPMAATRMFRQQWDGVLVEPAAE